MHRTLSAGRLIARVGMLNKKIEQSRMYTVGQTKHPETGELGLALYKNETCVGMYFCSVGAVKGEAKSNRGFWELFKECETADEALEKAALLCGCDHNQQDYQWILEQARDAHERIDKLNRELEAERKEHIKDFLENCKVFREKTEAKSLVIELQNRIYELERQVNDCTKKTETENEPEVLPVSMNAEENCIDDSEIQSAIIDLLLDSGIAPASETE